MDKAASGILHI